MFAFFRVLHAHILLLCLNMLIVICAFSVLPATFFLLEPADEQVDEFTWSFDVPQWPFALRNVFLWGMLPSLCLLSVLPSPGFEGGDFVL